MEGLSQGKQASGSGFRIARQSQPQQQQTAVQASTEPSAQTSAETPQKSFTEYVTGRHEEATALLDSFSDLCGARKQAVSGAQTCSYTSELHPVAYTFADLAKETGLRVSLDEIGRLAEEEEPEGLGAVRTALQEAIAKAPRPGLEELSDISRAAVQAFLTQCEGHGLHLPASAKLLLQFVIKAGCIPTKAEVLERETQRMEALRASVDNYPLSSCVTQDVDHEEYKAATKVYLELQDAVLDSFVCTSTLDDIARECDRWVASDAEVITEALRDEARPFWAMHRRELEDVSSLTVHSNTLDTRLKQLNDLSATSLEEKQRKLSINEAQTCDTWEVIHSSIANLKRLEMERYNITLSHHLENLECEQEQHSLEQRKTVLEAHLSKITDDGRALRERGEAIEEFIELLEGAAEKVKAWNGRVKEDLAATEDALRSYHLKVVTDLTSLLVHASQETEVKISVLEKQRREASMRRELCLEALDADSKTHAMEAHALDTEIAKKGETNTQIKGKLTSLFDHLTPTAEYLTHKGVNFVHPLTTVKNNHLLNTKIKIMEYRQLLLKAEHDIGRREQHTVEAPELG